MADYVTSETVTAFGHQFNGLADAAAIDLLVTASSRLFDNLCDVETDFFAVTSGSFTNKDFIGDGTAYLRLPPYTALNGTDPVLINNGTIAVPSFTTSNVPKYVDRNGALIVLDKTLRQNQDNFFTGISRFTGWPESKQIRVSAKWGFSAVPADVQLACVHICYQLWRTADPSFSIISGVEGSSAVTIKVPPIAQSVIDSYKAQYSRQALFA